MKSSRKIDNTSDPIVQEVYKNNCNYNVIETKSKSNLCIIFFSGNGIYFPNEEQEFIKTIINTNRFEWKNIANNKIFKDKAQKFIFLRDIHKQWYVEGISEEYNTIDKVFNLLKELTKGYKIITVGNSAGGYAAVLFGCLLKAEKIFSISGQFFFDEGRLTKEKLLSKHKKEECYSKYYDLNNIIKNYNGTIFYIFPCKVDQDIQQYHHICGFDNIFKIRIISNLHGDGLIPMNYKYIFFKESEELKTIINTEKEYTRLDIYNKTVPLYLIFSRIKVNLIYHTKRFIKSILKRN